MSKNLGIFFGAYLFLSLFIIFQLRYTIFDMFAASFPYKWSTSRKKAKAIRKEQTLFDRFTFRYTNEYICDRLKIVHKVFMIFKLLLDVWLVLSASYLVLLMLNLIPNIHSEKICGIIGWVSIVINFLLILLNNPSTRSSWFVDFKAK